MRLSELMFSVPLDTNMSFRRRSSQPTIHEKNKDIITQNKQKTKAMCGRLRHWNEEDPVVIAPGAYTHYTGHRPTM